MTFFGGSTDQAVAALLDINEAKLSDEQLDRLAAMVAHAKGQGR
jgi:hypothetical protein